MRVVLIFWSFILVKFPKLSSSNGRHNQCIYNNLNPFINSIIVNTRMMHCHDTENFDTANSRYWEWFHNPSSLTTYFHISNAKNKDCNLVGIFLLNCVISHMQIFMEIHVTMWHVNWFNRNYRLESILTMKDLVLVMFFIVSLALFMLIVYTIIFAKCVHSKGDLLIFHLQNFHSQDVNNLTRAATDIYCNFSFPSTYMRWILLPNII